MSCPTSGRWMDTAYTEGHEIRAILTPMSTGSTTKIWNELVVQSTMFGIRQIFVCCGFVNPSLELCSKKMGGKSQMICGRIFHDTPLTVPSTKGGQCQTRF